MSTSWSTRAACHGLDARLFFPGDDDDPTPAKAVCEGCEVREPCLEFALGSREREGVWGGCTEAERRRILRRRRRAS
jgi:WhiB family redox-sensing transcriptional regulator